MELDSELAEFTVCIVPCVGNRTHERPKLVAGTGEVSRCKSGGENVGSIIVVRVVGERVNFNHSVCLASVDNVFSN